MITDHIDTTPVECEGQAEGNSFGIADMSKAFHALTTQIYKNASFSVIAEICANAYDAQVQAGNADKPFYVHLPNYFEPFFKVRDYGISMSHEFMMDSKEGYCAAFYSTKNKTNQTNGAFGIGRLTLLALRDTYTAICYLNGEKRTYTIFKESGTPRILFLGAEATDEPNGFEVSVEISNLKFDAFAKDAASIFRFYPVHPEVRGANSFVPRTNVYTFRADDGSWGICEADYGRSFVVMGTYGYPIDTAHLPNLTNTQREILEYGIHINLPLGAVSVALSRDSLFYDDGEKTRNAIKAAVEKIQIDYQKQIQEDFEKCKTLFEAKQLYAKYFEDSNARELKRIIARGYRPIFNGEEITDFELWQDDADTETTIRCWRYDWSRRRYTLYSHICKSISVKSGFKIFIDKKDNRGVKARIKHLSETNQIVLPKGYNSLIYTCNLSNEFIQKHGLDIGQLSVINDVKLPRYGNSNGVVRTDKSKHKFFSSAYCGHENSNDWDIPEFGLEDLKDMDPGAFVLLHNYKTHSHISEQFSQLKRIGYDTNSIELVGIRANSLDTIKAFRDAGWVPLETYCNDIRKETFDKNIETIQEYHDLRQFKQETTFANLNASFYDKLKGECDTIKEYVETHDTLMKRLKTLESDSVIYNLYYGFSSQLTQSKEHFKKLQSTQEKILKDYPLLKFIPVSHFKYDPASIDATIHYMRLLKESRKANASTI